MANGYTGYTTPTSIPGMSGGGGGITDFLSGAGNIAGGVAQLIPLFQALGQSDDEQGQLGLPPELLSMLYQTLQQSQQANEMQLQRAQQQQPLFEAVTRGAAQRLPLSMRGILPTTEGEFSSPLIGPFTTFESPGAPPTDISQPGGGGAFGESPTGGTSIEDFLGSAPRRGGQDAGGGFQTAANVAGLAAAPFTFGLSALAGPIAGLFGGAAETAPTDFFVQDARRILTDAIQQFQNRAPKAGEIDELLRRQGWEVGDRFVGETGLRFLLNAISAGGDVGIAPGVEPEQVADLR